MPTAWETLVKFTEFRSDIKNYDDIALATAKGFANGAINTVIGLAEMTVPGQLYRDFPEMKKAITDWDGFVADNKQKRENTYNFLTENFDLNIPVGQGLITVSDKGKENLANATINKYNEIKVDIYNDPTVVYEAKGEAVFEIASSFVGIGELSALSKSVKGLRFYQSWMILYLQIKCYQNWKYQSQF